MTIDLDALETLAKAATPGPWMSDELSNVRCVNNDHICVVLVSPTFMGRTPTHEDAAFIAAANPASMLELLALLHEQAARIAELRKRTDLLQEVYANCGEKVDGACPVCMTYSHKHWCYYPALAKMLGKPLDENDKHFLMEEKK